MRFTAAIACWLVAFDCGKQASGTIQQHLFADGNLWLWGVVAVAWVYCGFKVLLNGAD